jgi:hypothetical protein
MEIFLSRDSKIQALIGGNTTIENIDGANKVNLNFHFAAFCLKLAALPCLIGL